MASGFKGVPGGRGPRQAQDYAEWMDSRKEQAHKLEPWRIRFHRDTNTPTVAEGGDLIMCEVGGIIQLPLVANHSGKNIKVVATRSMTTSIQVVVAGADTVDGDATVHVGKRCGAVELASNQRDTWYRVGGDQNMCFVLYRSASIAAYDLNDAAYIYFDSTRLDTCDLFTDGAASGTTQGLFTAPETGMYEFGGRIEADNFADTQHVTAYLYFDTVLRSRGSRIISGAAATTLAADVMSGPCYLAAGTTVGLESVFSGSAHTLSTGAGGQVIFWGRKLPN